jgi:hypothetical protein
VSSYPAGMTMSNRALIMLSDALRDVAPSEEPAGDASQQGSRRC